jgi:hypothetical protein
MTTIYLEIIPLLSGMGLIIAGYFQVRAEMRLRSNIESWMKAEQKTNPELVVRYWSGYDLKRWNVWMSSRGIAMILIGALLEFSLPLLRI